MYCSNLYCSSFWFDSSKTAMKKNKIAFNNSLRRLLSLPKHNSASEMIVNLNILSLGEVVIPTLLPLYILPFGLGWWHTILII